MEASQYIPIIVEATRFLFEEVRYWLRSGTTSGPMAAADASVQGDVLTPTEFAISARDPAAMRQIINDAVAGANAYEVKGLVEQLRIHRRNLVDYETTRSEHGSLTPVHIVRAIERESGAIEEKAAVLRRLLEDVFGKELAS